MPAVTAAAVSVSAAPPTPAYTAENRPVHHLNDTGTLFQNPWPSWRPQRAGDMASALYESLTTNATKVDPDIEQQVRLQSPGWGQGAAASAIKATWLGHACFLVELPAPAGAARGPRILYDPVFSGRCSPSQHIGPMRYTKPPCSIEDIPSPDIVVISHNHYDHMDTTTLKALLSLHKDHTHFFAPLGNGPYFASLGIPKTHFHCLDWWEERTISLKLEASAAAADSSSSPAAPLLDTSFKLTCTPCQHFTARGIFDRFKTLWSSWVVSPSDVENPAGYKVPHVFFGGDTAYRTVFKGEDEDTVPVCPAFKEIGEKFGGFDLALIPIGAYEPRYAMSPIHCAPQDSVLLYQDIKAKRAIGMHWGTWILTTEPVLEPPRRLAEECQKVGIEEGKFTTCGLGETVVV